MQLLLTSLHFYVDIFDFQIFQFAKRKAQWEAVAQILRNVATFSPGLH